MHHLPGPDNPLFSLALVSRRPEPFNRLDNSVDVARRNLQLLRIPIDRTDCILNRFAAGVESADRRLNLLGERLHLVHVGEQHFNFSALFGQRRGFARAHHRGWRAPANNILQGGECEGLHLLRLREL